MNTSLFYEFRQTVQEFISHTFFLRNPTQYAQQNDSVVLMQFNFNHWNAVKESKLNGLKYV